MTALELLGLISAALLLQLLMGAGLFIWPRRRSVHLLQSDRGVATPSSGAWPGWRAFKVTRRAFEDAAQSQCSFHLQLVDGQPLPRFKPGQYLTFALANVGAAPGAEGRSLTRCYSLSDRPDPGHYRITVKRALPPPGQPDLPPGVSSSHFHDHVHEGTVLQVKAPAGHFFIDPDASVPAVLVAGGVGITPMMSMLAWCLAEQPDRPVHLFYGVRSSADHAFKAALEALARAHPGFRLHMFYSSPEANDLHGEDYQHAGRVDVDLLSRNLPHGRHRFYVCGPPPMMQSLVPALRAWGVPEGDIHFEAFGPATVRPAAGGGATEPSPPLEVQFRRSGRTLLWNGQDANLLDFAERQHLALDSGCRTGSCGSCETRLVSGEVAYAEKPDHEVAPGHCLLCVGKPLSALVLEA